MAKGAKTTMETWWNPMFKKSVPKIQIALGGQIRD
jgi:hypothetical protein